jgi:hypothetical protein
MAEQLPLQKKIGMDLLAPCIPHIFTCLEDRSADVRKKANDILLPFMTHTGYEAMLRQTSKLKVCCVCMTYFTFDGLFVLSVKMAMYKFAAFVCVACIQGPDCDDAGEGAC